MTMYRSYRSPRAAKAVNLRTVFATDYQADEEPRILRVPAAKYLTLRPGYPYTESHLIDHMQRLYDVGFAVKMNCRQENKKYRPYAMSMVEVLTWGDSPGVYFASRPRVAWHWLLIMRTPAFVMQTDLDEGLTALRAQGKAYGPDEVGLRVIEEGECVQFLQRGVAKDDMTVAIRAKKYARDNHLVLTGLQHQIFVTNILHIRPIVPRIIYRYMARPSDEALPPGPPFA